MHHRRTRSQPLVLLLLLFVAAGVALTATALNDKTPSSTRRRQWRHPLVRRGVERRDRNFQLFASLHHHQQQQQQLRATDSAEELEAAAAASTTPASPAFPTIVGCDADDPLIVEAWHTQKLDHFDVVADDANAKRRTFGQRYFVNWRFADNATRGANPVVFLMLGGEGEMSRQWVCFEKYTYLELARQHKAIVIQLEHRFFGKNKNMLDLSTRNLTYLTSEQALADAVSFMLAFSGTQQLVEPRWVVFGGSYPGSLSAWLRAQYPGVSAGNVASSAPLWPKVDFWEYSAIMERTINATSAECYTNVGEAFRALKTATFDAEGRTSLTKAFKIAPPLSANADDITNFLSLIFGVFQDIIQYTYDGRRAANFEGLDIGTACRLMNNNDAAAATPSLIDRLAAVFALADRFDPITDPVAGTLDVRYAEGIAPMLNTSLESPAAADRGWMWLSCNEFGWLQTTDRGNSLFGDIISLGFYNKLCADLFGAPVTSDYIQRQVRKTQQTFGFPWSYNATNVILPNGAFDPWSALGTTVNNADVHQITVLTQGAAHCSDMYPAYVGEPAALNATRALIRAQVAYYLDSALNANKAPTPPTTPPPSPAPSTTPKGGAASNYAVSTLLQLLLLFSTTTFVSTRFRVF